MITKIINLYAGPGAGKSTLCAYLFAELKLRGINCEMALEYAKDKVWEGSEMALKNQPYIFGEQLQRIMRLNDKVDVIITDSPLLLSTIYDKTNSVNFKNFVYEEYSKFNNYDYFISRTKLYNPIGREQTEKEAMIIDTNIKNMLKFFNINYISVTGDREGAKTLLEEVIKDINIKFASDIFLEQSTALSNNLKNILENINFSDELNTNVELNTNENSFEIDDNFPNFPNVT